MTPRLSAHSTYGMTMDMTMDQADDNAKGNILLHQFVKCIRGSMTAIIGRYDINKIYENY